MVRAARQWTTPSYSTVRYVCVCVCVCVCVWRAGTDLTAQNCQAVRTLPAIRTHILMLSSPEPSASLCANEQCHDVCVCMFVCVCVSHMQMGIGRTTTGMVIAALVNIYRTGALEKTRYVCTHTHIHTHTHAHTHLLFIFSGPWQRTLACVSEYAQHGKCKYAFVQLPACSM